MLVAIDDNNQRRYADQSEKKDKNGEKIRYYCPECHSRLTLKKGKKNIHHFAHAEDTDCRLSMKNGESLIHMLMKRTIKEIVEENNNCIISELEWGIGNRIADYYFEVNDHQGNRRKIAVECVHRHTNIDEFRSKNSYYYRNGIYTIWIFNLTRFLKKDNTFKDEITTNEILKEAHTLNYGKVYAIDIPHKKVYAIHFDRIEREVEAVDLIDWEAWDGHSDPTIHEYTVGGYTRYLKNKREPNPRIIPRFIVNSFSRNPSDSFLWYPRAVASCYMKPYWK